MKKKTNSPKLTLKRQTLRKLDLEQVQGGRPIDAKGDRSNYDSCIVMTGNCW